MKNNIIHSYYRATIAMDGDGCKRAYSQFIRGSQYCLIVYSILIITSILIVSHQTSCQPCSIQLTEHMKEQNVKMNMIQFASIKHVGICFRIINIGPACAEEFACVEAADKFLLDENGNFLPDDQAIFSERIVTDCDIRGSLKFILKQN